MTSIFKSDPNGPLVGFVYVIKEIYHSNRKILRGEEIKYFDVA